MTWLRALRETARSGLRVERGRPDPLLALRAAGGVAVVIGLCLWLWSPAVAASSAFGAFAAGIATFQRSWRPRPVLALATGAGLAVSTFLGYLAGSHLVLFVALLAVWAFAAGLAWALGPTTGTVASLTVAVMLVVVTLPTSVLGALQHAGLIAVGGLVQAALILLFPVRRWGARRDALADAFAAQADFARRLRHDPLAPFDPAPLMTARNAAVVTARQARHRPEELHGSRVLAERIRPVLASLADPRVGAAPHGPERDRAREVLATAATVLDAVAHAIRRGEPVRLPPAARATLRAPAPDGGPAPTPTTPPPGVPARAPAGEATDGPPANGQSGGTTDGPADAPAGEATDGPAAGQTGPNPGRTADPPAARPTARTAPEPSARPTGPTAAQPTARSTDRPTGLNTPEPAAQPTDLPTARPTSPTTARPTDRPADGPSARPAGGPSARPAGGPSGELTGPARKSARKLVSLLAAAVDRADGSGPADAASTAYLLRPSVRELLPLTVRSVRRQVRGDSPVLRHALRLAAVAAAGYVLGSVLPLGHGYWAPLTSVMVMRPDFTQTYERGVGRFAGTLAGVAVASAVTQVAHPGPYPSAALAVLGVGLMYLLLSSGYVVWQVCLAAYVVFLLGMGGTQVEQTVRDRILLTLLGGVLAMVAYAVFPAWETPRLRDRLAEWLVAVAAYAAAVVGAYADPGNRRARAVRQALLDLRAAGAAWDQAVSRADVEPVRHRGLSRTAVRDADAALSALGRVGLLLEAHLPPRDAAPLPAAGAFAKALRETTAVAARDVRERRAPDFAPLREVLDGWEAGGPETVGEGEPMVRRGAELLVETLEELAEALRPRSPGRRHPAGGTTAAGRPEPPREARPATPSPTGPWGRPPPRPGGTTPAGPDR